ncbi:hypothetical protein CY34DRAFT_812239 [Suillus luteus UH-Slu-Lm8-n1]|uniref:Uncharacterized protein n=1 Tax=Suillus luteus UH-Slu-Lm8-n1 TaxID=930992 RepID=A0A0D0ATS7_9AGAM|nr:hypothetical protein CY34DRAFT_812239 [Suillus luteus UH-Slu-Lm8-n1]
MCNAVLRAGRQAGRTMQKTEINRTGPGKGRIRNRENARGAAAQHTTCATLSNPKQTYTIPTISPPSSFLRRVNLRQIVPSGALP